MTVQIRGNLEKSCDIVVGSNSFQKREFWMLNFTITVAYIALRLSFKLWKLVPSEHTTVGYIVLRFSFVFFFLFILLIRCRVHRALFVGRILFARPFGIFSSHLCILFLSFWYYVWDNIVPFVNKNIGIRECFSDLLCGWFRCGVFLSVLHARSCWIYIEKSC